MKHFILAKGYSFITIVIEMQGPVISYQWAVISDGEGEDLTAIATKDTKDTKDGAMMLRLLRGAQNRPLGGA